METRKLLIPLALLIIFGALSRLVPHPANFAPIAAMGLFSGVYLPWAFAFIVPLLAVFISDIFLGFYGSGMVYVYISYLMIGFLGLWLKRYKNFKNIILASLLSSVIFFIVSNFGVWASPKSFYSHDINGVISCYVAAIPFFRGTLLGDLSYSGLFFGGYELLRLISKRFFPTKTIDIF